MTEAGYHVSSREDSDFVPDFPIEKVVPTVWD